GGFEEQREYLEIVDKNAGRLISLINDLLDLSRIEAGRIELRLTTFELAPIISGVAGSLHPMIAGKEQRLSLDLATDLPAVWADSDRVTQVLTNLLSNAHKYTPAGGAIQVSARGQGGQVRVDVHDSGVGRTP